MEINGTWLGIAVSHFVFNVCACIRLFITDHERLFEGRCCEAMRDTLLKLRYWKNVAKDLPAVLHGKRSMGGSANAPLFWSMGLFALPAWIGCQWL